MKSDEAAWEVEMIFDQEISMLTEIAFVTTQAIREFLIHLKKQFDDKENKFDPVFFCQENPYLIVII